MTCICVDDLFISVLVPVVFIGSLLEETDGIVMVHQPHMVS